MGPERNRAGQDRPAGQYRGHAVCGEHAGWQCQQSAAGPGTRRLDHSGGRPNHQSVVEHSGLRGPGQEHVGQLRPVHCEGAGLL